MEKRLRLYAKWILVLSVAGICGCAGTALQHDYANYSSVYADSNNKQLLMNLAREQHDEPVYFVQLASISSEYQFSGSVGFNPSYVNNTPGSYLSSESTTMGATPPTGGNTFSEGFGSYFRHVLTLGGSVNSGFLQEPVYQFVPLTGSNFVQAILTPITDKVFLTLYDQGYPADMLARLMVESIQTKTVTTNAHQRVETNLVPVTYYQTNLEEFANPVVLELIQTNTVTFTNAVTATNGLTLGAAATNAFTLGANSIPLLTTNHLVVNVTNQVCFRVPCRTVLEYRTITNYDLTYSTNFELWVNDPDDRSYPKFLEVCFFLRMLQNRHYLTVHGGENQAGTVVYQNPEARLYDIATAAQSGLSPKYDPKTHEYTVTKSDQTLSLRLSTTNTSFESFENDNPTPYSYPVPNVTNIEETNVSENIGRRVLARIEPSMNIEVTNYVAMTVTNYAPNYVPAVNEKTFLAMLKMAKQLENSDARLKMKTVEVALYDAANQAQLFEERTNQSLLRGRYPGYHIKYKDYDRYGTFAIVNTSNDVSFAVRPVLVLNYDRFAVTNLITSVRASYEGKEYAIGDFKDEALGHQISNWNRPTTAEQDELVNVRLPRESPQTFNRDTFTVLSYLFSQVTIDTQKLPVQQLIQIQ